MQSFKNAIYTNPNKSNMVVLCDGLLYTVNASQIIRQGAIFGTSNIVFCPPRLHTLPKNYNSTIATYIIKNDKCELNTAFKKKAEYHAVGYEKYLKLHYNLDIVECAKFLCEQDYQIYVLENDKEANKIYNEQFTDEKICFIIGSEKYGVREEILNMKFKTIYIPSTIHIDSFNAASACLIAMYECSNKKRCREESTNVKSHKLTRRE